MALSLLCQVRTSVLPIVKVNTPNNHIYLLSHRNNWDSTPTKDGGDFSREGFVVVATENAAVRDGIVVEKFGSLRILVFSRFQCRAYVNHQILGL